MFNYVIIQLNKWVYRVCVIVLIKKLKKDVELYENRAKYMSQNCKFRDIKIENNKFKKGSEDKDCKMFFKQNNNNYFIVNRYIIKN